MSYINRLAIYIIILLLPFPVWATTYYVDPNLLVSPDGDHQYTELTGTQAAGNCLNTAGNYYNIEARDCTGTDATVKGYASPYIPVISVVGGETVYFRGGTHTVGKYNANYVNPGIAMWNEWPYKGSHSGTSDARITFRNYNDEDVVFQGNIDSNYGVHIQGRDWIYVTGSVGHPLVFQQIKFSMLIVDGNNNEISYCTFDQPYDSASTAEGLGQLRANSTYNWIHHNKFSRSGGQTATYDGQYALRIGSDEINQTSPADNSTFNVIENNEIWGGGHAALGVNSRYNVVRNNYVHHEPFIHLRGASFSSIAPAADQSNVPSTLLLS